MKRVGLCVYLAVLIGSVGCREYDIVETVQPQSVLPNANAGPDRVVQVGEEVSLSSELSVDPQGKELVEFIWVMRSLPEGSAAEFSDYESSSPSFVADKAGDYRMTLTVMNSDGFWDDLPDDLLITAEALPPEADAGVDQEVYLNEEVQLDGSGSSDSAGLTPLQWSWSFVSRPADSAATLSSELAEKPTFVPDVLGEYELQLGVQNSAQLWDPTPDTVIIYVRELILPPEAVATADASVFVGQALQLDGGASYDPANRTPLVYAWRLNGAPTGSSASLTQPDNAQTAFTPDVPGQYVFNLELKNSAGLWDLTPAEVVVEATVAPPVSDAGINQRVPVLSAVQLNGSASSDPWGLTPLSYAWTISGRPPGSSASLQNAGAVNPSFTPDLPGFYDIDLVVTNALGASDLTADSVVVEAMADAPVANAGPDQLVDVGTVVHLSGLGSTDPQGLALGYSWQLQSPVGSSASLTSSLGVAPSFTPDVAGTYTAILSVENSVGLVDPSPDSVQIVANTVVILPPVADAGPDLTPSPLQQLSLSASASYDPQGLAIVAYEWTLVSQPANSGANLYNTTLEAATFTPDVVGQYVLSLTVQNSDGQWDLTPDQLVLNVAPVDQFYVELTWDTNADLDLHLLNGSGPLYTRPGDCNHCNQRPAWGAPGVPDDPSLDIDHWDGWGPEITTITTPSAGNYAIKIQYYGQGNFSTCFSSLFCPVSQATVAIYIDGVLAHSVTQQMDTLDQVWNVGSVSWPSRSFTPDGSITFDPTKRCR